MNYEKFKFMIFGQKPNGQGLTVTHQKRKEKEKPEFKLVKGVWEVKVGSRIYRFQTYEQLVIGLSDMEFLGLIKEGTVEGLKR